MQVYICVPIMKLLTGPCTSAFSYSAAMDTRFLLMQVHVCRATTFANKSAL